MSLSSVIIRVVDSNGCGKKVRGCMEEGGRSVGTLGVSGVLEGEEGGCSCHGVCVF